MNLNIEPFVNAFQGAIVDAINGFSDDVISNAESSPDEPLELDDEVLQSVIDEGIEQNKALREATLEATQLLVDGATDEQAEDIETNAGLIIAFFVAKSLKEAINRIHAATVMRQMMPDERKETISKAIEISITNAESVAENEIGMSAAEYSESDATENGYSYFVYKTAEDESVRDKHKSRNNKIFRYGSQRVIDDVPRAAFRCRCDDYPLTDEEVLERLGDFFYPEDAPTGIGSMKKLEIKAKKRPEQIMAAVVVDGIIGDPWAYNDYEGFKFRAQQELQGDQSKELVIDITSSGGIAFSGLAAYSWLKDLPNRVVVNVYGYAASAATAFLAAADHVTADAVDQICIHNSWVDGAIGDADSLEATAKELRTLDASQVEAYKHKTGRTEQEIKELMARDTYITAREAMEFGLVDEIRGESPSMALPQAQKQNGDTMSAERVTELEGLLQASKDAGIRAEAETKVKAQTDKERIEALEAENAALQKTVEELQAVDTEALVAEQVAAQTKAAKDLEDTKALVVDLGLKAEGVTIEEIRASALKQVGLDDDSYTPDQNKIALTVYAKGKTPNAADKELGIRFSGQKQEQKTFATAADRMAAINAEEAK